MFPIGEQPEFIKDLNQFEEVPREIAIQGKTKNLERLKDLSGIEKLWLFSVNQEEFDLILRSVRPKTLYVYEMRVEDLSSLELLSGTETLYLCWNTKATKLWDLTKNINLKTLSLEDFKRLNSWTLYSIAKPLKSYLEKQDLSSVWTEIEPFLIGHLLIAPSLAQFIIKLIINHKSLVSENLLEELKINLHVSIEDGLDNEAQWIFWILSILEVKFSALEINDLIKKSQDDLLIIMLISYTYSLNKSTSKRIRTTLESLLDDLTHYNLRSERWLLLYEWYFNKWCGYKRLENIINDNDFFKVLIKKKVNFFT